MPDPALERREPSSRRLRSSAHRAVPRALAAAGLVAAGALVASCNFIINVGDYRVGDPCPSGDCAPATCGLEFASSKCASCVESTCCDEANACHDDAGCAPLYQCVTACAATDAKCRNECAAQHPVGANAAALALETCLSQTDRCGASCSTCGGLADWYADGCAACVLQKCCEYGTNCADDDACAERQRCYRACTYPSCPFECDLQIAAAAAEPTTADVIKKFDTCTTSGCGKQCAYGAHWGCVGKFVWPDATPGATVDITFDASDFTDDTKPVAGATVRVCARSDKDCSDPIVPAKDTDEKGSVTFSVPSGFNGYFDVTAPGAMESLVWLSWPVTTNQHYSIGIGAYQLYKDLVMSGGGTVDDTRGALFVFTYDCLLRPAPGVALEIDKESGDPQTSHFYFESGSPVSTTDATSADGIGGFSDVVPKTATLTATLGKGGPQIATFTADVRAQTITYVSLTPTP